jgi:hypothetical protein
MVTATMRDRLNAKRLVGAPAQQKQSGLIARHGGVAIGQTGVYKLNSSVPRGLLNLGGGRSSDSGLVGDSAAMPYLSGDRAIEITGDSLYPTEMLTRILEPIVEIPPALAGMHAFPVDDRGGWKKFSKLTYFSGSGEVGLFCCGAVPKSNFQQSALTPTPAEIHTFATSFDVCVLDLIRGNEFGDAYGGLTEESLKAQFAYQTLTQFQEQLIFNGEPSLNIYGLKNNPNVIRMHSPLPFDESATNEQIEGIVRVALQSATIASGGGSMPIDAAIMPVGLKSYLQSRLYGAKQGTLFSNLFAATAITPARIDESVACNTLGDAGSRAIVFFVDDPNYVELECPFPLGILEPHWDGVNLEFIMLTHQGSLHVKRPGSMVILSGV